MRKEKRSEIPRKATNFYQEQMKKCDYFLGSHGNEGFERGITLKERPIEIASKSKDIETNVSTVEREMPRKDSPNKREIEAIKGTLSSSKPNNEDQLMSGDPSASQDLKPGILSMPDSITRNLQDSTEEYKKKDRYKIGLTQGLGNIDISIKKNIEKTKVIQKTLKINKSKIE